MDKLSYKLSSEQRQELYTLLDLYSRDTDLQCQKVADWIDRLPTSKAAAVVTQNKGCNLHDDCAAFNAEYRKAHNTAFVPYNLHCHDDECEDCYGC